MTTPGILLVEADILVRNPLAEYLRECGYTVIEAASPDEARTLLSDATKNVDTIIVDIEASTEDGFSLAGWIRANRADVDVIIAASVAKATEKAGDLCEEGPATAKPYDHQFVLERIKRLRAERDRRKSGP